MPVAIVAIPEAQDRVYKISSERVPHLTLMHLGEGLAADALQRIVLFVEHVASQVPRFGLSVDRRGELGDKPADVLFFEKEYYAKELKEVVASLLSNRDIYEAYNSSAQFPKWIPHLTLGYPESPAKKVDDDYGVHYVQFDRIAVWTGDYDGPEFVLKREGNSLEVGWSSEQRDTGASAIERAVLAHASPTTQTIGDFYAKMAPEQRDIVDTVIGAALDDISLGDDPEIIDAFSALPALAQHLTAFIVGGALGTEEEIEHSDPNETYLAHYGVKGMKWGVRKDREATLHTSSANTKEARKAARAKVKAGTATLGEAHLAAIKSKGHRVANAMLGDKKFWTKQAPIYAAIVAGGAAAAFAAPAVLPTATLASIGASAMGVSGYTAGGVAVTSGGVTSTAALAAAGSQAVTTAGLTATAIGAQVYGAYASVSQYGRSILGNSRVSKSYSNLGDSVTQMQTTGGQRVRKTLSKNGGLRNRDLKQSMPLDNFVASIQEAQPEDALQFGVKGMKWGVRRSEKQLEAARANADPDAIKAVETQAKIKAAGSLNVVSSKDLQQLVDRLNLEQKYIKATLETSTTTKKGSSMLGKVAGLIGREFAMKASGKDGPLLQGYKFLKGRRDERAKALKESLEAAAEKRKEQAEAAKVQKDRERQARSYGRHPGPYAGNPAARRTARADQIYNVTTLAAQGNPLAIPPRRKP